MGKLFEVPVTPAAALNSSLMGIFQKRRYKNFLQWVLDVKADDPKTWGKCDLKKQTMEQIFAYWKCDDNTVAFTGHAIALFPDDSYLKDASRTIDCIERLQLYAMISAQVYTAQPKKELAVAFRLFGKVLKDFFMVNDTYEATNGAVDDGVFIPSSMDATTHFERTTNEVMAIYKQITGEDVDLNAQPETLGQDQ